MHLCIQDRQVLLTTSLYGVLGLIYTISDEVFPLWAMAEKSEGGLGFSTSGNLQIIIWLSCNLSNNPPPDFI